MENHLPLFSAILPQNFLNEHPEVETALDYNKDQMFTGLDVHETLVHLINYPEKPEPVSVGESLLVPLTRGNTCKEANIPEEYCPCL